MTGQQATGDLEVKLVGIDHSATFRVELPERAVEALKAIGDFGVDGLARAIQRTLSESEAKKHAEGLRDLVLIGHRCAPTLKRLHDARAVISGSKVAIDQPPQS